MKIQQRLMGSILILSAKLLVDYNLILEIAEEARAAIVKQHAWAK